VPIKNAPESVESDHDALRAFRALETERALDTGRFLVTQAEDDLRFPDRIKFEPKSQAVSVDSVQIKGDAAFKS
jgi:hypothetical protein